MEPITNPHACFHVPSTYPHDALLHDYILYSLHGPGAFTDGTIGTIWHSLSASDFRCLHKKLSCSRETARQLSWLAAVQSTEHRRIADVVQLDYSQIISTVSAKKASDIRGRWSFSFIFQGHQSLCHAHISRYLRNALSEKLPILAALLRFVYSYALTPAKLRTNLFCSETTVHWPHFSRWKLRAMFTHFFYPLSALEATTYVRQACRPLSAL